MFSWGKKSKKQNHKVGREMKLLLFFIIKVFYQKYIVLVEFVYKLLGAINDHDQWV
jgi:hypothetical protein